jgi:hypothetical protein
VGARDAVGALATYFVAALSAPLRGVYGKLKALSRAQSLRFAPTPAWKVI